MTKQETNKTWEQQTNEKAKPYYFFLLFLEHKNNTTIPKFYKKLQKQYTQNTEFSYKLPTLSTIENYAYRNGWLNRKEAYQKYQNELLLDEIQQDYFDNLKEIFGLNQEITIKGLNKAKELLSDEKFSGFNFEKVMRGLDIAVQNNRLTTGEPTEIISSENKNLNVEVDKSEDLLDLFKNKIKEVKSDSDVSNNE